jgi:hypothetical protein
LLLKLGLARLSNLVPESGHQALEDSNDVRAGEVLLEGDRDSV